MQRRTKPTGIAHTKQGYRVKVRQSHDGSMTPTNWKIQAVTLGGQMVITKRMANRRRRKAAERAFGLAKWMDAQRVAGVNVHA